MVPSNQGLFGKLKWPHGVATQGSFNMCLAKGGQWWVPIAFNWQWYRKKPLISWQQLSLMLSQMATTALGCHLHSHHGATEVISNWIALSPQDNMVVNDHYNAAVVQETQWCVGTTRVEVQRLALPSLSCQQPSRVETCRELSWPV